jgi:hypothetical protein
LRVQRVALGPKLARQLQLAHRNLLQIDAAIQQVVEAASREQEFDPARPAQRVQPADLALKGAQVLVVGELVMRELQLRIGKLGFDRLGLGRDRRQVGIALRQLDLQGSQRLAQLALLAFQRTQPLLLPRLLLLDPRQPVGKRAGIFRVGRYRGEKKQQRGQRGCRADYSGGAPAEPGMPGSRRGVKVVPPNGGVTPFGFFSFFFFFSSRRPRSRDFAMVLPP